MKKLLLLLPLTCALLATAATTLISRSGSGGTLTAPVAIGQKISISAVSLSGGGTAIMSCPITAFGAGTYQWNWKCAGGHLTVNGVVVASVSGTMKLACSGGGRFSRITCWHSFAGTATAGAVSGPVAITARGGSHNGPGTVTNFAATW
ncbi:MAG TPA: hypothetical protein VGL22_21620 [Terracidiphilus sp.]|jgi:hypothetical protein